MSKILKVVGASWLQTKISSYILGILGILAILALFVGQMERIQEDGNYTATVFHSNKTGYRIEYWGQSNELANIPRGVARAYFRKDVDTKGWSMLEVETDSSYPDDVQAYAAGIVEGALTWSLIHSHLENTIRAKCDQQLQKQCDKLRDELDKSVKVWKSYAAERGNVDPFWHQVSLYYTQISGIYTGWKHGVERKMVEYETDVSDLYWLNAAAEVAEIQKRLNLTIDNAALYNLPDLSSAFIRITDDTTHEGFKTKKMYVAQNAAGSYTSMTRILKRYKLNYHVTAKNAALVQGTSIDFSSYPGSITSQDEYYILRGENHRMAITGTPLRNYNTKLWKEVNITEQVPVGPRVTAANRLATNASAWGHALATYNSGTGSKQWLIVDFNKFDNLHTAKYNDTELPKNEIVAEITVNKNVKHTVVHRGTSGRTKGLVGLLEQVPALTHFVDLSDTVLEQEYFALYGLPYFKDIADVTRINEMEDLHGEIYSKSESQRAILFKQGYKNATGLKAIIELMRQNNLTAMNRDNETTECSDDTECLLKERGYWGVLGARGDLLNNFQEAYGVIDTKVVSCSLSTRALEFTAVAGPPYTRLPNANETAPVNKGNIATIYTDQFDDKPTIDGIEIRDLVKQQQEQAVQESLELLNRYAIPAFQWSESKFENVTHEGLPDTWAFDSYKPTWSW